MALREVGFAAINTTQQSILEQLCVSGDVICQARGATGKTSTIGLILSERLLGEGVYFIVVPNPVLKDELLISLRRFLHFDCILVHDIAKISTLEDSTSVIVGQPSEFHVAKSFMGVRVPRLIVMDEADELFEDPALIASILNGFVSPSTKTLALSATFPPYILSRIEEALMSADETRSEEPVRIHHCVSTSTRPEDNPVRDSVDYFYTVVQDYESVSDVVWSILSQHKYERALITNCTFPQASKLASVLSSHTQVCLVDSLTIDLTSTDVHKVLIDPSGILSRGVNIPGLDLGISLSINESKETILHQWARVGRSATHSKYFMVLTSADELNQLRYLEFQLGVSFQEYSHSCLFAPSHPFHIHPRTADRLVAVAKLLS